MKFFRSKSYHLENGGLSRKEALECVPVILESVTSLTGNDGEILLEYPLQLSPFLHSLFVRFQKNYTQPTKKIALDSMGSMVWNMINGENTVKTIIIDFAAIQKITREEAEQSVTLFLAQLGKKGLIAMR